MKMTYHALIIDDEKDICELIEMSFLSININCYKAYSVSDAIVALQKEKFDVCFTDLKLPDGDGFDVINYIMTHQPELPIAMMTAHGNIENAIEALKLGAFDFISKPFEIDHLRKLAQEAIKSNQYIQENHSLHNMYGKSEKMNEVRNIISKLARSKAPVYINGESGTGKELAAHAIHDEGSRRDGPFIAVNCGAIPEQLVESEFFGHVKGSFTGADQNKIGLFEAANDGTIFLDEIADLPMQMQVKLLRAIQERTVRPVGGTKEIPINCRIISASHKNLEELVTKQEFRQDLFYRLNVITLNLPPLRDRIGDIPVLSHKLLEIINQTNGTQVKISDGAVKTLSAYRFPGNIRELENILERACALCNNEIITEKDLQLVSNNITTSHNSADNSVNTHSQAKELPIVNDKKSENIPPHFLSEHDALPTDIEQYLSQIEEDIIRRALRENKNKTEAAKSLGISFRQFRYRLKKLGIEDEE